MTTTTKAEAAMIAHSEAIRQKRAHIHTAQPIGHRVYYTGDMANQPAYGWVTGFDGRDLDVVFDADEGTPEGERLHRGLGLCLFGDAPGNRFRVLAETMPPLEAQALGARARTAQDAMRAERDRLQAEKHAREAQNLAKIRAARPPWAKAALIAKYEIDACDRTTRRVFLCWSKHTRDVFSEMRRAATLLPETAYLAAAGAEAEHREKYSMGGGYYLKAGITHATGWTVYKQWADSISGDVEFNGD